jgi:hypothetical protein
MRGPDVKPVVQLTGEDGNAFGVMGRVKRALARQGADQEYINKYLQESMGGDYDGLLQTAMKYVNVH